MNNERSKTFIALGILIASVLIAVILVMSRPTIEQKLSTPVEPLVDVVKVSKRQVAIPVAVQGNVRARTQTQLIADVAGRITWVSERFVAGGYFKKGEQLARIDDRNYVAAVKRAQAAIAGAKSVLATEKGRTEVALREWNQGAKNAKRSAAATELYLRKPQLVEAKARLASAHADLLQAEADLEHTIVRAPYDAMVGDKAVDLGQSVSQGVMLGSVFAIDSAEVRVPLPEKELQFLAIPNTFSEESQHFPKVKVSGTGAFSRQLWEGRLIRTEGVLNERTRSMTAVIEVQDPYGLLGNEEHRKMPLRMGSYVNAVIDGKPINDLIKLSQAAINPGNKVWLVNGEGRLEVRTVDILTRTADSAYISGGLDHADIVSLTTLSSFTTGAKVRIASVNGETPKDSLKLSPEQNSAASEPNTEHEAPAVSASNAAL